MNSRARAWLVDIVVGGIAGGLTGAIAAVNFVIFIGIDDGYEASIAEVFRQNTMAGVVTVAILGFSPVCGVVAARRLRRKRERRETL
ncbi:MAG: hypothetical protein QNL12_14490 [Acidimicrobiia bacterium]|nr:hypothetical protein [Acidimicrobiia bacterium]MDX2468524.1 hypothetical protein [Acidimicrobiia bacterium]